MKHIETQSEYQRQRARAVASGFSGKPRPQGPAYANPKAGSTGIEFADWLQRSATGRGTNEVANIVGTWNGALDYLGDLAHRDLVVSNAARSVWTVKAGARVASFPMVPGQAKGSK